MRVQGPKGTYNYNGRLRMIFLVKWCLSITNIILCLRILQINIYRATIAKQYDNHWVALESAPIQIMRAYSVLSAERTSIANRVGEVNDFRVIYFEIN